VAPVAIVNGYRVSLQENIELYLDLL
jgi:hypothetical protein